jgi:membrane-associated phospholipid phosphatase
MASLLVTHGTTNELFVSGHTALVVYGSIVLGRWGGPAWAIVGILIVLPEMTTVIVLRTHYTMDVFAGAVTAISAAVIAAWIAPTCNHLFVQLGQRIGLS